MSDQNTQPAQPQVAQVNGPPATGAPGLATTAASAPGVVAKRLEPAPKLGWLNTTFVTILPLYIIVLAVCLIALPKGITGTWFGGGGVAQQSLATSSLPPAAASATLSTSTSTSTSAAVDGRSVADVAKMAIDSSKDRADAMKDTYDKLFSLFAAFGALLAFLGFKGLDTFVAAKRRSEEIVVTANSAVDAANEARARAEEAVARADQAIKDHAEFVKVRYAADNSAEINTAHGIIMREIASLYEVLLKMHKPDAVVETDSSYRSYLDIGRHYLDKVTDRPDGLSAKVVARAFITRGNILRRQGDYLGALKMAEIVIDKYHPSEQTPALYNAACYCCLLAEQEASITNNGRSRDYRQRSLAYLKRAIEADPNLREDVVDDPDFNWFRERCDPRYGELLK